MDFLSYGNRFLLFNLDLLSQLWPLLRILTTAEKLHCGTPFAEQLFPVHHQNRTCNFIKKEALAQVFSSEFGDIFKNNFFIEQL